MRFPRVQLRSWQAMVMVAIFANALVFGRYFWEFVDSPLFGPDPKGERSIAPIRFVIRANLCGTAAWLLVGLWKRFGVRDARLAAAKFPNPPEPD